MVRKSVQDFSNAMEGVLQANDYKGGWEDMGIDYLNWRLTQEFGEYFANYNGLSLAEKRKELLDIANFCMMLWHKQI